MTPRKDRGKRGQPKTTRIEQVAKAARQKKREWKNHPVLKSAALGERGVRYTGRGIAGTARLAGRVSVGTVRVAGRMRAATGRFASAYSHAYAHGRGQNLTRWARSRRDWIARHVELDTSGMSRAALPGMSARRRALYVAARSRRHTRQARTDTARRMVRAAGLMAASERAMHRQLGRGMHVAAGWVVPNRNRAGHPRNRAAKPPRATPKPPGRASRPPGRAQPRSAPPPKPTTETPKPQPKPPTALPKPAPKHHTETPPPREGLTMAPTGGHPAQIIGKGGVDLGSLLPATDTNLIWTLERVSAATLMVGNGALAFAETLDSVGLDPKVVEPLKGYAQHVADAAGFPLTAHRQFWALYGHRIAPAGSVGRAVQLDGFFGDQRKS